MVEEGRDGPGLNLTEQVRDGILRHTGPEKPGTLEGRLVRIVDRVAYINHDIDDAVRAGIISESDLPAEEIELLGATGPERVDALVQDMVERSRAAGDIDQSEEVGGAMLRLRKFMFDRVYLGAEARGEQERAREALSALFAHYVAHPEELPAPDPGRRPAAAGDRLPGGDDRPLLPDDLREPRSLRGVGLVSGLRRRPRERLRGMARFSKDSVDRVKDAADMVEVVSAYTDLRQRGKDWWGLCPFHDESTPSFKVNPLDKLYYCFGCEASGDVFSFVEEKEGLSFPEAVESVAERYGVELEREAEDPRAEAARRKRARLYELLERTSQFYVKYLWEGEKREAVRARAYLAERGLEEEALRRFGVGFAPNRWDAVLLGGQSAGFKLEELFDAGLLRRNKRGPYDYFRQRIMFPIRDQRGRVLGFGARAQRPEEKAKYVNSPEGDLYRKGSTAVRDRPRPLGDREGEAGDRRRGLHGRDRAAPGGDRGGGGDHGHGDHAGAAEDARRADRDGGAGARR